MERGDVGTRTFRWLFLMAAFQLLCCFLVPALLFPARILLPIEILNALTVGLLFGLYLMGVSIYGLFADERRRKLYGAIIGIVAAWALCAALTWRFIEHMPYLC